MAACVMGGALLSLVFSLVSFGPPFRSLPHEALGQALAGEAIKVLGPGGRIIIVTRDSGAFPSPATEAQLESFVRAVRKAGAAPARTNLLKVDPLRLVAVPAEEFLGILRSTSTNDVVASFLGPSPLTAAQRAKLGAQHARVAAVCSGTLPERMDLKSLFENRLLDAAIVSRRVVASPAPVADTTQGWFDHLYQVITRSNLSDLPPRSTASRRLNSEAP